MCDTISCFWFVSWKLSGFNKHFGYRHAKSTNLKPSLWFPKGSHHWFTSLPPPKKSWLKYGKVNNRRKNALQMYVLKGDWERQATQEWCRLWNSWFLSYVPLSIWPFKDTFSMLYLKTLDKINEIYINNALDISFYVVWQYYYEEICHVSSPHWRSFGPMGTSTKNITF